MNDLTESLQKKIAMLFLLVCNKYGIEPTPRRLHNFTNALIPYAARCHAYHWTPSIKGMALFYKQTRDGVRRRYTYVDKP